MRIDVKKLLIAVLGCQAVGALGAIITFPSIASGWYSMLNKPDFTPPSAVFGPVWTVLYLLMGLSLYILWVRWSAASKRGKSKKLAPVTRLALQSALVLSVLQLAFNFSWSLFFFGFQLPTVALVVIVVLWISVATIIAKAWRVSSIAGLLLLPYLAWISFAGLLNLYIVMMN
ncbi:MAG TPA: TspO/MBR family protein [Candidatus Saccharimonadia bacterium]|nr:TspO/MBR family protein [Candidatus Saccharimonadia bacterium]